MVRGVNITGKTTYCVRGGLPLGMKSFALGWQAEWSGIFGAIREV
jgi:hypothetical protein